MFLIIKLNYYQIKLTIFLHKFFFKVGWFVKEVVIVCPKPDKPTLNSDTVLFIDKGQKVLGRICEVFGPVKDPHYSVRFNSSEHIEQRGIKKGMLVYYSPGDLYTTLVFLKDLEK